MAQKPARQAPKVPRSTVARTAPAPTPRETPLPPGISVSAPGKPQPPGTAQEYAYIRRDLARIAILSALIFGGMFVLKFVVGL